MSGSHRLRRRIAVTSALVTAVSAALLFLAFGRADADGTAPTAAPTTIVRAPQPTTARTEPSAGSTVHALDHVVLHFDEPVDVAAHLWLEGEDGVVPLEHVAFLDGDRTTLTAPVPPVASGAYVLGFHVLAVSGRALVGSTPFVFDRPPA